MINDITQYKIRYELWGLDNSSYLDKFYVEFLKDDIVNFFSLSGEVLNLSEEFQICTRIPIDLSPDLIPIWLL